jgi:hypothetical protein
MDGVFIQQDSGGKSNNYKKRDLVPVEKISLIKGMKL